MLCVVRPRERVNCTAKRTFVDANLWAMARVLREVKRETARENIVTVNPMWYVLSRVSNWSDNRADRAGDK